MNLNLTKVHTQGIPLIEGGSLFLLEKAFGPDTDLTLVILSTLY